MCRPRTAREGITDPESREQVETLEQNARDFGVEYFAMDDIRQGIVHIIGPEQGWTLPGTTIVCGDSHTSTHGAFGALAFGIGTSEVEHVLATQTLRAQHSKNMRVTVNGKLPDGVTAKDIALAVIAKIGTAGGTGYVIEYAGEAVRAPVDGRAHDAVQPHHRGRRPRRPDRGGRHHHRLCQGPSARAQGRGVRSGGALLADAEIRSRRAIRCRGRRWMRATSCRW